jgi:TatD DNase family protein
LHCFTGDRDTARRALDAGYYLSLAGIVTFPRALELKEVARLVPLDRLLIETDSPFLAPVPHRGKRNEPAHVARVAEVIGELKGVTRDEVAAVTAENFVRIFVP